MTNAPIRYALRLLMAAALAASCAAPALSATLLPPGKNCFYGSDGAPLASGTVSFYIPQTLSPKDTWQDADQTTLNTNPVSLDASGCAVIYGVGTYRQILKNSVGTTIWDQPTSDGKSLSVSWGGTSTGSANAQAVALDTFDLTDGQVVNFLAGFSNSSAMTLDVNSTGPVAVVRDSSAGPVALVGAEIIAGNAVSVLYSEATGQFHILTPTPIQSFDGALYINGVITPTPLASDQNDWTPTGGYATANTVRASATVAINITGLTGGASGRIIILHNVGSGDITLIPRSSSSATANQFLFATPWILRTDDAIMLQYDATNTGWRRTDPASATLPPGYINGCTLSNNVTDPTNDIDFATCAAYAGNASVDIRAVAMTKRLDATWAAGSGQGMRSSAALADGTWHYFTISTASGAGDYFAHTSTDPTSVLPSGYVNYRRIGSVVRAGGSIKLFAQNGNYFRLRTPTLDVDTNVQDATAITRTLSSVPSGLRLQVEMNVLSGNAGGPIQVYLKNPDDTDSAVSLVNAPLSTVTSVGTATQAYQAQVWTNTSAQITSRATTTNTVLKIAPLGYLDLRE